MKKRKLFDDLFAEKDIEKISIVLGPRQVGKTTLLKQLHQAICKNEPGIYLDLDIISNFEKVSSYENLINFITLEGYDKSTSSFFYLFLDEFQRYPGFSKILKNIIDNHDNIKIYATGSSSLRIKDEIQESLAGRKNIHHLFPLDFEEFIIFKNDKTGLKYLENVDRLSGRDAGIPLLYQYLTEFMIFGSYHLHQNPKIK